MTTYVVSAGQEIDGLTLNNGDTLTVASGGIVSGIVVNFGGQEIIAAGGSAYDGIVNAGGTEIVSGASATDTGTIVKAGGSQTVTSNAYVHSETVSSGGSLIVAAGGEADNTTVSSGGVVSVSNSGTIDFSTVTSGGLVVVNPGGTAWSTDVESGATLALLPGAATSNTHGDGKVVTSNIILLSGAVPVSFSTIMVSANEQLIVDVTVNSGVAVSSDGVVNIAASGSLPIAAIVSSGGLLTIGSGGSVGFGLIYGTEIVYGTQTDTSPYRTLSPQFNTNDAGLQIVMGGGEVADNIVTGVQIISSGGLALRDYLSSGGSVSVGSGGTLSSSFILSGGLAEVFSGGQAINTQVTAGGALIVLPGGSASNTTGTVLSSGDVLLSGTKVVSAAPIPTNALITAGEELLLLPGGNAISAHIGSGAEIIAESGGIALGSIISSGGVEIVSSGGYSIYANVSSGGTETIASGGTLLDAYLSTGAKLDLAFAGYYGGGSADFNYITDILTVTEGGSTYTEQLTGNYTGEYFHLATDGSGGTLVTLTEAPCYCPGTLILTDNGEKPVEALSIGDRLMTHSGEFKPVKWIGTRSYVGRFITGRKDILPICFKAGSISENVPRRDLWISPHHAMYLDGLLIEAKDLVNGVSIVQASCVDQVAYYHVELESHDVIIAEGAWSETFIDDDSRSMFHNAPDYYALYSEEARCEQRYYAPRIDEGEPLETIKEMLSVRALGVRTDRAA